MFGDLCRLADIMRVGCEKCRGRKMPSDSADAYREECRREVERTPYPSNKEGWLKLAEDWQRLAQSVEAGARPG
jgi:hypothetical protein